MSHKLHLAVDTIHKMRYPGFLNFFTKQYYYYSRILIFFIYPNITTKQNIFHEVNKILYHNVVKNWRNNCHSKKRRHVVSLVNSNRFYFHFLSSKKKHDQASLNFFFFEIIIISSRAFPGWGLFNDFALRLTINCCWRFLDVSDGCIRGLGLTFPLNQCPFTFLSSFILEGCFQYSFLVHFSAITSADTSSNE